VGLGGYLTWTAACHEIHNKHGKRVLPVEVHGPQTRLVISPIFKNNPSIVDASIDDLTNYARDFNIVPLNLPATNYCKHDSPTHARHSYDKHIISQILDFYKIDHVFEQVKCRLYFTSKEDDEINKFTSDIGTEFVTIEPHSNNEYTCNREYPFEKWQNVVNALSKTVRVVQVGQSTKRVLDNVLDMTGKTTFRTCAGLIGKSKLFLSSEGGLTHAAQAVSTKSIVVITGYQHPTMVAYPQNTNLWVHGDHGPCGKKQRCSSCWEAVVKHDEQEIVGAALEFLHDGRIHERVL
jgi:ADP-heptose:LPS heptosyltransferase